MSGSRSEAVKKAWITRRASRERKAAHAYARYADFNLGRGKSVYGSDVIRLPQGWKAGRAKVLPGGGVKLSRQLSSLGFSGMKRKRRPMIGKKD